MEFLPFLPFMAVSVPESFVLYYMGTVIFGYKSLLSRLITAAVITSTVSYLIRSMPILFGIHTIIQLIMMVFIFRLIFGLPILLSVTTTFISAFILGLTESISVPLLGWVFGVSYKDIISDPLLRFLFGIFHFSVLAAVIYSISRKGWYLSSIKNALIREKGDKHGQVRKFYLFIISILQALMLVFLNVNFYIYKEKVFPTFQLSHLVFSTSIIIIASSIITVFVANRLIGVINREAKLEAELNHIREMQNLNLKMRSQRHDFYNHITSLYGFVRGGHYEEAKNYMESLYQDIKKVKELLELDPPALGALLSLKMEKADALGVEFYWGTDIDKGTLPVSIQELTQVLGNLLDNAIEAAQHAEPKTVRLNLECGPLGLIINVKNSSNLSRDILDKIFLPGFSTKDTGEHSGLGLYIVKEIVNRHKGEIHLGDPENFPGLEIQVFIPQRLAP